MIKIFIIIFFYYSAYSGAGAVINEEQRPGSHSSGAGAGTNEEQRPDSIAQQQSANTTEYDTTKDPAIAEQAGNIHNFYNTCQIQIEAEDDFYNGVAECDAVIPLGNTNEDEAVFLQPGFILSIKNAGEPKKLLSISSGLIHRFTVDEGVLGFNLFYDGQRGLDSGFTYRHRLGLGVDYQSNRDMFSLNYYYPLQEWTSFNEFYEERALEGVEFRFRRLFSERVEGGMDLSHWDSDIGGDSTIARMGFDYKINCLASVGFEAERDFETDESTGLFQYTIILGENTRYQGKDCLQKQYESAQTGRLYAVVQREKQIRVERRRKAPTLAIPNQTSHEGADFSLTIDRSNFRGVREEEHPTISTTSLPNGLTYDKNNMQFSGTLAESGTHTVDGTITVPTVEEEGEWGFTITTVLPEDTTPDPTDPPPEEPTTPQDEATSTEDTATDDTPEEETPAEDTPTDDTPEEETPAEEVLSRETTAEETPAEETTPTDPPPTEQPPEEQPPEEPPPEQPPEEQPPEEQPPEEQPPEQPPEEQPPEEQPPEEQPPEEQPPEEPPPEQPPSDSTLGPTIMIPVDNSAPTLTAQNQTVEIGESLNYAPTIGDLQAGESYTVAVNTAGAGAPTVTWDNTNSRFTINASSATLGAYTVSGTITDTNNNSSNWSFKVTVADTKTPRLTAQNIIMRASQTKYSRANITNKRTGEDITVTVSSVSPSAGAPSVTYDSANGRFTITSGTSSGSFTVSGTIKDASNNSSNWSFTVVVDTQAPTLNAQIQHLNLHAQLHYTPTIRDRKTGEAVTVRVSSITPSAGAPTVTWNTVNERFTIVAGASAKSFTVSGTIRDAVGNVSSWSFTVVVLVLE